MSRQSGLPLLSYAASVRVTPSLGYNALIAALCNVRYVVFMRHTFVAPCWRGDKQNGDATTVIP